MKGHPGTGKSALARRLASTLSWPVVDKDDARDCIEASLMPLTGGNGNGGGIASSSGGGGPPSAAPASPAAAVVAPRVLNDLSYDIMFRVAASQLSCGLSVIVDCPLARRELYERASALAAPQGAAVVVVECVPASEEAWREAIDTRVANAALEPGLAAAARHKPRSWEALQQLVRAYGGASEWTAAAGVRSASASGAGAAAAGAGGGGAAGEGSPGVAASPRAATAAPPVVPHYLSVRTLRHSGSGSGGSKQDAAAAADAATRAAADEVVAWLRRRGLCGAGAGAGGGGAEGGDGATETVEIPVQGVHMPAIAE